MADHQQQAVAPPLPTETQHNDTNTIHSQRLEFVPDSLLALAKDTRYVKECQSLFLQILSSLLPRRSHPLMEQESWILASLVCLALGLTQTTKGTSLGMEAVGLQFPSAASRWKLVANTLVTLSWAYAFSTHRINISSTANLVADSNTTTTTTSINGSDYASRDALQNDEQLRGVSRRDCHERLRRAMLARASRAASVASSTTQAASAVITGNATPQIDCHSERQRYSSIPDSTQLRQRTTLLDCAASLRKKVKSILMVLARVLASATWSPFEGPHTLPPDSNQQRQDWHNQPETAAIQHAGRWLAKLQLAHFCSMGLYPTWIHRFSGHALMPVAGEASRLYYQPTTALLVGLMLGAQLAVTVIHAITPAVSRRMVERQQYTARSLSTSLSQQQPIPAVVFQSAGGGNDGTSDATLRGTDGSSSICSICKMGRKNPAAPISCGHVFCWRCLCQWVSGIRPECPLCRATCRPQDILALYNYSPNR